MGEGVVGRRQGIGGLSFDSWAKTCLETIPSPWGCSSPGEVTKLRGHLELHCGWKNMGMRASSLYKQKHRPQESGRFPTLGARAWENATAFPSPLSRHTCAGRPHDPLDLSSFVPANKRAVNDKVTEQQHLVLGHQRAGGRSAYPAHPSSWLCRNALQVSSFCMEMIGNPPCSEDSLYGAKEAKLFTVGLGETKVRLA